jgi:predicted phage terminase large subunit-like protein
MGYYEELAETIFKRMRESREILLDPTPHEDLYQIALNISDHKAAHELNVHSRKALASAMRQTEHSKRLYEVYKRSLLMDAPRYLDEYMLYIESDRPVEERFYQTRRGTLKQTVDILQKLNDDELDEGFFAQPPRTGKTTLIVFTTTWRMGAFPNSPNLYSSYSDTITRSFYNAVLEIMTDADTYKYADVFPNATNLKTNAAEETIDIGARHHYPTLTCRSIDGTLNGACDVDGGWAIGDDFVSGYEEALSKDRLQKLWGKVSNNYISRGKETTKFIWMGTRWSLFDPEGMRLELLQNGLQNGRRRFAVINIPALDDHDNSNFDYPYRKGFSTDAYLQLRENFERNNDMASWSAQYMGEPIERDGTLFNAPEFNYFMGTLPDVEPDRVFMAVDPAFGGGDFVAAPVCVQYGGKVYVVDVVYNDGEKRVTIPEIAFKAMKYHVNTIQVEMNKATENYAEYLRKELETVGHRAVILPRQSATQKSKMNRIWDRACEIREHFVFLSAPQRTKEYNMFMKNVFSYCPFLEKSGMRHQHDDAPDALAQAAEFIAKESVSFQIVKRPW